MGKGQLGVSIKDRRARWRLRADALGAEDEARRARCERKSVAGLCPRPARQVRRRPHGDVVVAAEAAVVRRFVAAHARGRHAEAILDRVHLHLNKGVREKRERPAAGVGVFTTTGGGKKRDQHCKRTTNVPLGSTRSERSWPSTIEPWTSKRGASLWIVMEDATAAEAGSRRAAESRDTIWRYRGYTGSRRIPTAGSAVALFLFPKFPFLFPLHHTVT